MSNVTTYSNKSNARRAARKVFADDNLFELVQNDAGRWYFEGVNAEVADETPVAGGLVYCPHCGVHLSNGYTTHVDDKELEHEFCCLGCEGQFGEPVSRVEAKPKGKGLKIQKDREERNGIKRPSEGGKCAAVWNEAERVYNETKMVPTPKVLKAWAEEGGYNLNNVAIELYRWRAFMGFKGRK